LAETALSEEFLVKTTAIRFLYKNLEYGLFGMVLVGARGEEDAMAAIAQTNSQQQNLSVAGPNVFPVRFNNRTKRYVFYFLEMVILARLHWSRRSGIN
jgi:hypothetical protein